MRLEYWFIKFHVGELAFLVDFIARRDTAEVRLSLWVRGAGRVARLRSPHWRAAGSDVAIGDCVFSASGSLGAVDDVEWDLSFDLGGSRVAPRVPLLSRLRPFDLELTSWPRARFGGSVTVAGERFAVHDTPGSVTHYAGRRLPDRWHWISADGFEDSDLVVEAVVLRTRLWGARPALPAGYLWTSSGGRERTLVSPLNGLLTVHGRPDDFTVVARSPGRSTRLRCTADSARYNDLGEGIRQTLLGTCVVDGRTDRRAGLEIRDQPG